ncbi:MAG: hypothetical protein JW850_08120 [Thermoflexales bacterium]|nr:hypothetical protein [Thermoflexales bacterium]
MEQIIYLHSEDDILSVRDQLNLVGAPRVMLVIPPYSDVLRSRVDLRLVQRQAEQLKFELALVTRDSQMVREAGEIGLPVFGSVEQGRKRSNWRRPGLDEDPWSPGRSDEAWQAASARRTRRPSRPAQVMRQVLAWTLFVGVFLGFALTAALAVPSAEVTLVPDSEAMNVSLYVAFDTDIEQVDVARTRIPAEYVAAEVAGTVQVPTTGKKAIPASPARGTVVFINQLGIPINIPKGTAVRTSAFGSVMRYFTTVDVSVPGGFGAQAEAPIEAMEPGEFANIGANLINEVEGVAAISVKVTNPYPTAGGGSREVPAVTQEDRDRARSQLMQNLLGDAYQQMQVEMGEQELIVAESLFVSQVLDETYDRFVTEEAQTVVLEMRLTVLGLKGHMADANTLAYAEMVAQVPPEYELIADGLAFEPGEIIVPADANGDILMEMTAKGYIAARFDRDQIRQAIAGKPVEQAVSYLAEELPLRFDPVVAVRPEWLGRVPWLPVRIQIEIRQQA